MGRERAQGALVEEEAWLTRGVHEGGTWHEVSARWTRTEVHWRTVREWGADRPGVLTWHDLTWSWLTKKGAVLMN